MTIDECKANLRMISILMDDNEQAEVIELTCENACEWLEELKDYRDKNKIAVKIDVENIDSMKDKCIEIAKEYYNKALDDIKTKIDDEYYDGGYGDYHEVEMIVRMIEQLRK